MNAADYLQGVFGLAQLALAFGIFMKGLLILKARRNEDQDN